MVFERRVDVVQRALNHAIDTMAPSDTPKGPADRLRPGSRLVAAQALALFADMVRSREIDVAARDRSGRVRSFYTISSAGHEMNAVVGALTRTSDPAFLHYRSGGFIMARGRQDPDVDSVRDTMLSIAASADDPIAGGRHKVWGSRRLWVPPQTSTIASHVPKAVGTAFALPRARRVGVTTELPDDALVVCSFGDASANHATALAGINAARYAHRRGNPTPILFVCEDNGLGISVDTPKGWIAEAFARQSHLRYVHAAGEVDEVWDAVAEAVDLCRAARAPVFVHLPTVRLWGHAGSDVETAYRPKEAIAADERRDPLLAAAHRLVATGAADPQQLRSIVDDVRDEVRRAAELAAARGHLPDRAAVMAPLAPYRERRTRQDALTAAGAGAMAARDRRRGSDLPETAASPTRRTLAAHLNAALYDELAHRPEMLVFGEDVGAKGGVYHVTAGLQAAFGPGRVFDTLLDETTILGVAQGAALIGLLPVAEIQYLAYVHNALDQLRGEASSLSFFSDGQFTNPMVVRIAGLAYQRGFGGHFHNDNAIGALRDIPGLAIAVPARPADGARLLRGAVAMAKANGRVVVVLEPIALYHEKDLYREGDGLWLEDYPAPGEALLPGEVGLHHDDAGDVLIVTYGNGVRMSLRTARRLANEGIACRVLDLRWLAPLPLERVREHAAQCGRVLVADECRATGGGVADAIVADLAEHGFRGPITTARSADSFVPLGPAAAHVLLGEDDIVAAARRLLQRPSADTGPSAGARRAVVAGDVREDRC